MTVRANCHEEVGEIKFLVQDANEIQVIRNSKLMTSSRVRKVKIQGLAVGAQAVIDKAYLGKVWLRNCF